MVIGDLIPVLWLCGPPGVGKSTVGWEIFAQLTETGIEAGDVDIDQLGMCYPERVSDPGRHRMKAQNLGAVVANYRAAGARCVIVSGVAGPDRGLHAGMVPLAAFTVCRLRGWVQVAGSRRICPAVSAMNSAAPAGGGQARHLRQ